jgi:hypothetical protein
MEQLHESQLLRAQAEDVASCVQNQESREGIEQADQFRTRDKKNQRHWR